MKMKKILAALLLVLFFLDTLPISDIQAGSYPEYDIYVERPAAEAGTQFYHNAKYEPTTGLTVSARSMTATATESQSCSAKAQPFQTFKAAQQICATWTKPLTKSAASTRRFPKCQCPGN